MKKKLVYIGLFFALILSCKKDQEAPSSTSVAALPASDTLSLAAAKTYVNTTPAAQTTGTGHHFSLSHLTIPWEKAEHLPNKKSGYWLVSLQGKPVLNNTPQGYRKLALMRDSAGHIRARILEIIPDGIPYQRAQQIHTGNFTGRIFIYDENYRLLSGLVYSGGKPIGRIKPTAVAPSLSPKPQVAMMSVTQDCTWYDSNYIDSEGILTVYSEYDCSYSFYDSAVSGGGDAGLDLGSGDFAGEGGGGGGDTSGAPDVSNLPGEDHSKIDPSKYLICFGNVPTNSTTKLQVTVYVQEPWPGTFFNIGPNSVGHTAIGLTKTTGNVSITQTMGFYPNATGKDKMRAPGKLVDNSALDYNVSITYTVDAVQFANLINYLNSPLPNYDITALNCTGYTYKACQYAGITLPDPYTTVGLPYPDGTQSVAMTPAGLGNSIRNMKDKTGVNTDGGRTTLSHGPCN
jgi:hypothetical protein